MDFTEWLKGVGAYTPALAYGRGNEKLLIYHDEDAEDPREWDNLSVMLCWHPQYNLGDDWTTLVELRCLAYDWDDVERYIRKKYNPAVMLPLKLYDHGGITITAGYAAERWPYNCRWDSTGVGYIFVPLGKALKEHGWRCVSKKRRALLTKFMLGELATYDEYLRGECYYAVHWVGEDQGDACDGFIGEHPEVVECMLDNFGLGNISEWERIYG